MHQGLFGLSPFEVFFGRKANENIEYIQNIGELYIPSVSEESYAAWMQKADKNYLVAKWFLGMETNSRH